MGGAALLLTVVGLALGDPTSGVGSGLANSEGLVPVNGTELWVKRVGSGEPIVIVHGGPVLEHGYLLPHLAPLAEDYELIFFDQRLSGRSAAVVDESSVRLATFAEDIEALRVELGLERIHLMAHSWGGLLAMHYAGKYPSNLRSLMLLDSMAPSAGLWQAEQEALAKTTSAAAIAERQEIMSTEAFAARRPEAIRELLLLSFRGQFADSRKISALELYVPEDYMERSQRFGGLGPELESFDLRAELSRLDVPTLVLYGSAEPGAGLGGAAIHEAIPGSEFVLVEGAGHFPFVEQPAAFLASVRKFLGGVARTRAEAGSHLCWIWASITA